MDCVPCGQDGCEGSKVSRCLLELSPEEVVERLEQFLKTGAAG
jgi:heptosyltransferase-3